VWKYYNNLSVPEDKILHVPNNYISHTLW